MISSSTYAFMATYFMPDDSSVFFDTERVFFKTHNQIRSWTPLKLYNDGTEKYVDIDKEFNFGPWKD